MVFLAMVAVFAAGVASLFLYFRSQPDRRSLWRRTVVIGIGVGVSRAGLASLGWYIVEHTGGPLQVPAFALAMLAWPEAAILDERRTKAAPPEFYVSLALLLVVSTLFAVIVVALASVRTRR